MLPGMAGKGRVRSTILSRTAPQPRAFLEALCQVLGHCPAFGARTGERERAVPGTGLSQANAVARRLCAALCQWQGKCSSFGARTGRALQDCSALSRCRSDCFAICGGAGARPPPLKRYPIGFAFGPCAAVLPCAPCARTQGTATLCNRSIAKQKRRGGEMAGKVQSRSTEPSPGARAAGGRTRSQQVAALPHGKPPFGGSTTKGGAHRAPPSISAFALRESPSRNLSWTKPRTPQRPCRTSWSRPSQASRRRRSCRRRFR